MEFTIDFIARCIAAQNFENINFIKEQINSTSRGGGISQSDNIFIITNNNSISTANIYNTATVEGV